MISSTNTGSTEFKFTSKSSRGAVLVLPDGGSSVELVKLRDIRVYIERNAVSWYRHINGKLGREISNGSLYVITGLDRCASWGVAAFSNPEGKNLSFRFLENTGTTKSGSQIPWSKKYHWRKDRVVDTATKTGPDILQTIPNQCIFLRGYRVALKPPDPGHPSQNHFETEVLPITKLRPQDLTVVRGSLYIPFGVDSQEGFSPDIAGASSSERCNSRPSVRGLPTAFILISYSDKSHSSQTILRTPSTPLFLTL